MPTPKSKQDITTDQAKPVKKSPITAKASKPRKTSASEPIRKGKSAKLAAVFLHDKPKAAPPKPSYSTLAMLSAIVNQDEVGLAQALARGPDLGTQHQYSMVPLRLALRRCDSDDLDNSVKLVQLLVDHGFKTDPSNHSGWQQDVLNRACEAPFEAVKALIEGGFDPNAVLDKDTPHFQ